jgi:glutaredoxin
MTVIAEHDRMTVRRLLTEGLERDVELIFFTQSRTRESTSEHPDCDTCADTAELLDELVGLSDRLRLTTHDVTDDPEVATRYNVTAVPMVLLRPVNLNQDPARLDGDGTVGPASPARSTAAGSRQGLANHTVSNVRFLGQPGGYEFTTLIEDLVDLGKGTTGLASTTVEAVRAIDVPVHIQVFVTPACPYCPRVARLAHQLAMENTLIVADVIEANEFPVLSERYQVRSVPKTVINDRVQIVGSISEATVLEGLTRAISHGH